MGSRFFCGINGIGEVRRGVIAFDVAGSVPPCATIVSVDLALEVVQSVNIDLSCSLHRILEPWGEGASIATVMGQGQGGAAAAGDATWIHTFFPGTAWSTPGGAFATSASGALIVGRSGPHTWRSTPGMVADVQSWLDAPATDYGWLVRTDESAPSTTKAFATKEDANPVLRPALRVTYVVPSAQSVSTGTGSGAGATPLALATNGRRDRRRARAHAAAPAAGEPGVVLPVAVGAGVRGGRDERSARSIQRVDAGVRLVRSRGRYRRAMTSRYSASTRVVPSVARLCCDQSASRSPASRARPFASSASRVRTVGP